MQQLFIFEKEKGNKSTMMKNVIIAYYFSITTEPKVTIFDD